MTCSVPGAMQVPVYAVTEQVLMSEWIHVNLRF